MKTLSTAATLILVSSACSVPNSSETRTVQLSELGSGSAEDASGLVSPSRLNAQLVEHADFDSEYVQVRNITVWLPDGYLPYGHERYPVIYAHDGQNLFEPGRSYGGVEWGLDETAERMMRTGDLPPAIIVGIWNTDERWQEYAPQKVIESLSGNTSSEWLGPTLPTLKADAYLKFITEELKPFIDETYQTAPAREQTYIMGSSMGGLISLYAMAEYPDTFSRAAAVSIHWPLTEPDGNLAQQADAAMQAYLSTSGLDKTRQTIWFDHGTETLDAAYPPHAAAMERWFRAQGWGEDEAIFRAYPGTDHSEGAWAARADEILAFLLSEDHSSD
ncbi:MAG: alpha/beta hydrolase-fold protein [Pseudomonadota bacterium]